MSTLKVTNIAGLTGSSTNIIQVIPKLWINYDNSGGNSISDSYNVTSFTDHAVGESTLNFTSNFANSDYACTTMNSDSIASGDQSSRTSFGSSTYPMATSSHRYNTQAVNSGSQGREDSNANMYSAIGDLA